MAPRANGSTTEQARGKAAAPPAPKPAPAAEKKSAEQIVAELCALLKGVVDDKGRVTPTTHETLIEHVQLMKGNYEKSVVERRELSQAWRQLSKTLG